MSSGWVGNFILGKAGFEGKISDCIGNVDADIFGAGAVNCVLKFSALIALDGDTQREAIFLSSDSGHIILDGVFIEFVDVSLISGITDDGLEILFLDTDNGVVGSKDAVDDGLEEAPRNRHLV